MAGETRRRGRSGGVDQEEGTQWLGRTGGDAVGGTEARSGTGVLSSALPMRPTRTSHPLGLYARGALSQRRSSGGA